MNNYKEAYEKEHVLRIRNARMINCMGKWISLKQKGININDFFLDRECKKIAIYGASQLGVLFYEEIKLNPEIEVICFFDKKARRINSEQSMKIKVYEPTEYYNQTGEIDMVVVTPIFFFDEIEEELLRQMPDIPIINLEKILIYGENKRE